MVYNAMPKDKSNARNSQNVNNYEKFNNLIMMCLSVIKLSVP
jgi:hypothetical protein